MIINFRQIAAARRVFHLIKSAIIDPARFAQTESAFRETNLTQLSFCRRAQPIKNPADSEWILPLQEPHRPEPMHPRHRQSRAK